MTSSKRTMHLTLVLLVAAAWLAPVLHPWAHAGHAHRFCVEHQALEEAGARAAPASDVAAVDALPAALDVDGHQACPLPSVAVARATAPEPQGLPGAAPAVAAVPDVGAPRPAPIAVLHLAPKASPPA